MQQDIAGIGQHQGRHGKYATFYAKREMSEDFRDTPLVRTPVSRNATGVLHYIFASWKNIVASGKLNSCKKQHGNSVTGCKEGCPIRLPKENVRPDAGALTKEVDESTRCLPCGSRKSQAD